MSVIGYLRQCQRCDVRMLVTADAKDMRHCPDCLTAEVMEIIERRQAAVAGADEEYPLGEVRG